MRPVGTTCAAQPEVPPTCPWLSVPDERMADVLRMLRDLRATLDALADHPRAGLYVLLTRGVGHPNAVVAPPPPFDDPDPPTTDLAIPWQLLENEP